MNLPSPTFASTILALILSTACSDPPSPPAQGAVSELIGPNGTGNGCAASGPEFTAPPNTDAQNGTSASLQCDTSAGTGCSPDSNVVVDGDQNAIVTCSVSGGGPFNVTANLNQGPVAFNLQGVFTDTGGTGFLSSGHDNFNLQQKDCKIIIEANHGEIKPGAIWARFDCESYFDPSTPGNGPGCAATGFFIFENCAK